jgi:hypothetical protein
MKTLEQLKARLVELNETAKAILAKADAENRDLTPEEQQEHDLVCQEFEQVEGDIARRERNECSGAAHRAAAMTRASGRRRPYYRPRDCARLSSARTGRRASSRKKHERQRRMQTPGGITADVASSHGNAILTRLADSRRFPASTPGANRPAERSQRDDNRSEAAAPSTAGKRQARERLEFLIGCRGTSDLFRGALEKRGNHGRPPNQLAESKNSARQPSNSSRTRNRFSAGRTASHPGRAQATRRDLRAVRRHRSRTGPYQRYFARPSYRGGRPLNRSSASRSKAGPASCALPGRATQGPSRPGGSRISANSQGSLNAILASSRT